MHSFVASPTSRNDIRYMTQTIRRISELTKELRFPIVEFFEFSLPEIVDGFTFAICDHHEMGNNYGLTFPEKRLIQIREDVYCRACKGEGRDRFTLAHELGHLLMHRSSRVALARVHQNVPIPKYQDPEWQANVFAAELLAPATMIAKLTLFDIIVGCEVSAQVAEIQKRVVSQKK